MQTMTINGNQIHYVAENFRWMLGETKLSLCPDGALRGKDVVIQLSKDELAQLKFLQDVAFYENLDEADKAAHVARIKHALAVEIDFCKCECDCTQETRHYDVRARKLEKALESNDVFEMMRALSANK